MIKFTTLHKIAWVMEFAKANIKIESINNLGHAAKKAVELAK